MNMVNVTVEDKESIYASLEETLQAICAEAKTKLPLDHTLKVGKYERYWDVAPPPLSHYFIGYKKSAPKRFLGTLLHTLTLGMSSGEHVVDKKFYVMTESDGPVFPSPGISTKVCQCYSRDDALLEIAQPHLEAWTNKWGIPNLNIKKC